MGMRREDTTVNDELGEGGMTDLDAGIWTCASGLMDLLRGSSRSTLQGS
jgi:hypothetical protein